MINYLITAIVITQVPNIDYPLGYQSIGLPPQQRSKASLINADFALYLYGGSPLKYSEIWEYNLTNSEWTPIITLDQNLNQIDPISETALFINNQTQKIYRFGGISEWGLNGDMKSFDLISKKVNNK